MIPTGLGKLDKILGGGVRIGTITDIIGERGVGKTHLAMQISISAISMGGRVLFLDTTGGFRPERMVEILQSKKMDHNLLNNVEVGRITNTSEQLEVFSKILESKNYSLLVIDNVSDLFSFEYPKKGQSLKKNIALMKFMHSLSFFAVKKKLPVVITNTLTQFEEKEIENLEKAINIFTHVKIKLAKTDHRRIGNVISPYDQGEFYFNISQEGITDSS